MGDASSSASRAREGVEAATGLNGGALCKASRRAVDVNRPWPFGPPCQIATHGMKSLCGNTRRASTCLDSKCSAKTPQL